DRHVEVDAAARFPRASEPAAAGSLFLRDHDVAFRCAFAAERHRIAVGRARDLEHEDAFADAQAFGARVDRRLAQHRRRRDQPVAARADAVDLVTAVLERGDVLPDRGARDSEPLGKMLTRDEVVRLFERREDAAPCAHTRSPTSMLTSAARAECVSRPSEIESGPALAYATTFSSVMPPDTSISARPPIHCTASRTASGVKLSSSTEVAPAASAMRTCSSVSHSTSMGTPSGALAIAARTASAIPPAAITWLSLISTASNRPMR